MPEMTEALLFDFNGVIVDDEEQHRQALEAVLASAGIALTREQYYAEYLGWNDEMCFVTAFRDRGERLAAERVDELVRDKSRRYEALIARSLILVPGAREFIERAAGRFRLGLVSGALRREIELVLERTGLARHFEVIVAAEDVPACKPDPAGYLAAHIALDRRRPLLAGRCVAIEDSLPGLAAAHAAGMRCAMLSTSHAAATLGDADVVWASFAGHDPTELLTLDGA
jgi:HAD superfamily hydrolase (TIGR01509 family)